MFTSLAMRRSVAVGDTFRFGPNHDRWIARLGAGFREARFTWVPRGTGRFERCDRLAEETIAKQTVLWRGASAPSFTAHPR